MTLAPPPSAVRGVTAEVGMQDVVGTAERLRAMSSADRAAALGALAPAVRLALAELLLPWGPVRLPSAAPLTATAVRRRALLRMLMRARAAGGQRAVRTVLQREVGGGADPREAAALLALLLELDT